MQQFYDRNNGHTKQRCSDCKLVHGVWPAVHVVASLTVRQTPQFKIAAAQHVAHILCFRRDCSACCERVFYWVDC